jgi:hypothetical protein
MDGDDAPRLPVLDVNRIRRVAPDKDIPFLQVPKSRPISGNSI